MKNDIHIEEKKPNFIKFFILGLIIGFFLFLLYNIFFNQKIVEEASYNQQMVREVETVRPGQLEAYIRDQKIVERIILSNPEIIINALKIYDEKRQEEMKIINPEVLTEALQTKDAIVIGSKNPVLTIVKFNDFNCGFCRKSGQELLKIMQERNDIRLIIRDTPIITKESKDLAKINQALLLQSNEYAFEFYKKIEKLTQAIDTEKAFDIAEEIGADMEKLKKDFSSSEIQNKVEDALILSQKVPVTGTPTFIIGQKRYEGYMDYETLNQTILKEMDK